MYVCVYVLVVSYNNFSPSDKYLIAVAMHVMFVSIATDILRILLYKLHSSVCRLVKLCMFVL